jgi:hypothetical protein
MRRTPRHHGSPITGSDTGSPPWATVPAAFSEPDPWLTQREAAYEKT